MGKILLMKTFTVSLFLSFQDNDVQVKAIVKEARTDVHLEGSTNVTYRDSPYKVKILDNTPNVFKPGLPFSVFVSFGFLETTKISASISAFVLFYS